MTKTQFKEITALARRLLEGKEESERVKDVWGVKEPAPVENTNSQVFISLQLGIIHTYMAEKKYRSQVYQNSSANHSDTQLNYIAYSATYIG